MAKERVDVAIKNKAGATKQAAQESAKTGTKKDINVVERSGRPSDTTSDLTQPAQRQSANSITEAPKQSAVMQSSPVSTTSNVETKETAAMAATPSTPSTQRPSDLAPKTAQQSTSTASSASGYEQSGASSIKSIADNALNTNAARTDASRSVMNKAQNRITDIRNNPTERAQEEVETTVSTDLTEEVSDIEEQNADPINDANKAAPFQPTSPNTRESVSNAFKKEEKANKERTKEGVSGKNYSGNSIVVKTYGHRDVPFDAMSVGTDEIMSMIAQPGNNLLALVEQETGEQINTSEPGWIWSLMDLVNQSQIEVGVYKSPVNRASSGQRRYLKIHTGRGGRLHPTQSKSFNADFDGDDFTVVFDQNKIQSLKPAMAYLIDIDGSVTLDPDFFPTPKIVGNGITHYDAKQYISNMFKNTGRDISPALIDSIFDLCEKPDSNKSSSSYWYDFAQTIYLESNRIAPHDPYSVMSILLKRTYDGLREISVIKAELAVSAEQDSLYQMPTKTNGDNAVIRILEDMHGGKPAMNFQDFKVAMNKYVGDVDGKNIAFRISADVAKMVKMNDRINIGSNVFIEDNGKEDESNSFFNLYQQTMAMGESLRMSNLSSMDDRILYAAEMLRNRVLRRVGLPSDLKYKGDFNAFIQTFYDVYSEEEQLINIANVEFLTDFTARTGKTSVASMHDDTLGSIVGPFEKIYGGFTLGRLMSSISAFDIDQVAINKNNKERDAWIDSKTKIQLINYKYMDFTVSDFVKSNLLYANEDSARQANKKSIGEFNISDLLLSLADRKTRKASKYNTTLCGEYDSKTGKYKHYEKDSKGDSKPISLLAKMNDAIRDLNVLIEGQNTTDWSLFSNDITELLYSTSPELFSHFGMGDPVSFLESKYGKALLDAKSADMVGGVRIAMMVEQRMSKIEGEHSRFNDVIANTHSSIEEIENAANRTAFEIDALASSSQAWNAIVEERYSNRAWKYLAANKATGKEVGKTHGTKQAPKYWADPKHDNLYNLLMDTTVGISLKSDVLRDVVCFHERSFNFKNYEMPYQLEQGQSNIYSAIGASDEMNVLDALEEAGKKFDRRGAKSYHAASMNIEEAYHTFKDQPGEPLLTTLKRIVDDPSLLVQVNDQIIADAIASPLDKMFAVSEKSGQMPGPNSLYQALSYQRNGGLYTDVYRGDDRALGILRWDMVTPMDLISVLADPDKTLHVYGRNGELAPISRDILCGVDNAQEGDVWNFLRSNPRLGMAIRMHQVNAIADSEGKTYMSAECSTTELIYAATADNYDSTYNKIKSAMIDHPMFHAMAAIITPTEQRTSRTISNDYKKAERYLIGELTRLAKIVKNGEMFDIQYEINNILNISVDSLIGENGMQIDEDIANNLLAYLSDSLNRYAVEIADIIDDSSYNISQEEFTPNPDLSSVAMYFDVMQELHGSKTAISTGIEGTETYKMAVWMSLLSPKDNYDIVDTLTDLETIAKLNGCMTNVGIPINESNLAELVNMAGDDGLIVEVPDDYVVQDQMLDNYGNQVSSVNRFLVVKRDKGAEEFNLKLKKFGIDDMDSITKNTKFSDTNYLRLLSDLRQEYSNNENRLFSAKMLLAKHIKAENEAMGYDDMDLSNYMSIADLMLIEKDGEIYLRSIEQISYAIKNQISRSVVRDDLSINEARGIAAEIADQVGVEEVGGNKIDPVELMSGIKIAGKSPFSPVLRQRSSSWHRNYNLIQEIKKQTNGRKASDEEVDRIIGHYAGQIKRNDLRPWESIEDAGYRFIGIIGEQKVNSIGPTEFLMISKFATKEQIAEGLVDAAKYGNTVFVENDQLDLIPDNLKKAIVPFENGYIIPMFDLRLNGSEAKPYTPTSASWQCDPSRVVLTFENSINDYSQGDSDIQLFKNLTDRMSFDWGDNTSISSGELFADTFNAYPNANFTVDFATREDIQRFLVNGVGEYEIDYGIATIPNSTLTEERERMNKRIEKYLANFTTADKNGMLTEAEPDDIIGWVRCKINNPGEQTMYVLAPIIPFRIQGTMSVPTKYTIEGYDFGVATGKGPNAEIVNDKSAFTIQWRYSGDTEGQWVKMHESAGAANKTVGSTDGIEGPALRSGVKLDGCYALETTASRRGGSGKRIATMNTMMFMARMDPYGYNFAQDSAGAFPENREEGGLWERFKTERFTTSEWKMIKDSDIRIHEDDDLNNFCRSMIDKCIERDINPSDFFASEFNSDPTYVWFEFESIYEQGEFFQDQLMRFMHSMMPSLVPDGLQGEWQRCLMRPDRNNCLQMQVPHQSARNKGEVFWVWETVYAGWGFFGEDYSGFKRPSMHGSSRFMDAINTMALSGQEPSGFEFKKMLSWALSDIGGYNMPYGMTPEKR